MKELAKKFLVRWLAVELLVSVVVLALTPFLFGSIKPFKPLVKPLRLESSVKINQAMPIALKKAAKKASEHQTKSKELKRNKNSGTKKGSNNIKLTGKNKTQIDSGDHNIGILPGEDSPQIIE